MSYDDAAKYLIDLYEKETDPEKKELLKFEWGMDFGAPHETEITKLHDKPVFVYLLHAYGYVTPGIATMFLLGILWKRATHAGVLTASSVASSSETSITRAAICQKR